MKLTEAKPSITHKNRNLAVDVLRGSSLVLMIIFHFGYDLTVFGYTHYDTNIEIEWRIFRAVIVSGFLLAMGMSSYLAYNKQVNIRKLSKNLIKLFTVSVVISVGSYVAYPSNWIYFGIIHFVAVALPLSLLFIHRPNFSFILAIMILMGYFSDVVSLELPWAWSVEHLGIPSHTVDLVSLVPWFALVLIGIFLIHHQWLPTIKVNKGSRFLARLGQHSLLIYLLHQPVLFAGFYVVQQMTR